MPLLLVVLCSGCAVIEQIERPNDASSAGDTQATSAPPPPASARTVEDFDTTTRAERVAATTTDTGGRRLGRTVASLGDPTRPGFWIMTPLVDAEGAGRLEYPAKGTSVEVTLLPAEGGSSRVSLAALRLLEAPLTDLAELEVFAK